MEMYKLSDVLEARTNDKIQKDCSPEVQELFRNCPYNDTSALCSRGWHNGFLGMSETIVYRIPENFPPADQIIDDTWEPEFLEEVMVSANGRSWYKRLFVCKTEDYTYVVSGIHEEDVKMGRSFTSLPWEHMKRIEPDEPTIKLTVEINGKPAKLSDISEETLNKLREEN